MNNHGQKSSDHCQNKNNTNLNTCRQRTGFCTSGTYQIQKRLLFRSLRSKRSIDHACVKQLSLLNVYNKLRKHCEAYHTPLILLSEMQFMQHKNHQFNIGIAWNTHYKTKPQCQKNSSFIYYQLILFLFTVRGALAHPGQYYITNIAIGPQSRS